MRLAALAFIFVTLAPLDSVVAQDSQSVKPGDLVRITVGLPPHEPIVRTGVFVGVADESFVLDIARVPLDSIARIEVNVGSHNHVGAGLGIGFLVGAGVGALVLGTGDTCVDTQTGLTPEICALFGAGIGGLAGLFVGGITGAFIKSDRWEEVPLDQLRVSFVPLRDGRFAFGLSVAF